MHQPPSHSELAWVARSWLAGVCLLALRIAFGLLLLEQLRRRNLSALPVEFVERCRALQQRLGIRACVRYCECRLVTVPAVIGFFRPIVLLPMRALTGLTPNQLEAVIAHELGHIKRFDVAVNFFQVIAETLFFFHPAVWWLNKRIRADREDCCDDVAIAACGGKAGYARALATMEEWRDVPDFAMAATGGSVAARVARLLGVSEQKTGARTAGVFTASLVLMAALSAGAVSIGIVKPGRRSRLHRRGTRAPGAGRCPCRAPAAPAKPPRRLEARPAAKPRGGQPRRPQRPNPPPNPANPASPRNSYIAQMKSAGFDNLDVDQLIAMRVHDITPEYVRAFATWVSAPIRTRSSHEGSRRHARIREEHSRHGLRSDVEEIGMKVQDVTPEYVEEIRAMGFKPDADEIIAMKVHDITPEYVK